MFFINRLEKILRSIASFMRHNPSIMAFTNYNTFDNFTIHVRTCSDIHSLLFYAPYLFKAWMIMTLLVFLSFFPLCRCSFINSHRFAKDVAVAVSLCFNMSREC